MQAGLKFLFSWLAALALMLGSSAGASAEELTIGGTGAALGSMRLLAAAFRTRNPGILVTVVPSLGSSGAVKAMLDGAISLAVTSRPLQESERRSGAAELEYARTPFVFAVSVESRVTAITTAELADIYAGRMTSWPDGSPTRVVLRPTSDIDTDLIMSMSPALRKGILAAHARPGVRVSITDQDASDDLEKIPGTIGPSTLALILSENRPLRALKLDAVAATAGNAASGAYPYFKRLYLVTGPQAQPAAAHFIAFVLSPAGRRILSANGQWIP